MLPVVIILRIKKFNISFFNFLKLLHEWLNLEHCALREKECHEGITMKKKLSFYLFIFVLLVSDATFCCGMADHGKNRYQFKMALENGFELRNGLGFITFIKLLPSHSLVAIDNLNQGIVLRNGYKECQPILLDNGILSINDVQEQNDLISINTSVGDYFLSWKNVRNPQQFYSGYEKDGESEEGILRNAPISISWQKIQSDRELFLLNESILSYNPSVMLDNGDFSFFYDPIKESFYNKKSSDQKMSCGRDILVGPCSPIDVASQDLHANSNFGSRIPAIFSYTVYGQWLFCGHANGIISVWEDSQYCSICKAYFCSWSLQDELLEKLAA